MPLDEPVDDSMAPTLGTTLEDQTNPSDEGSFELRPGSVIDRYVVLTKLGGGGMGVVYAAHDPELDRKVALKLLRSSFHHDREARARLLREARALAKLSHPNVVTVHDVGVHQDRVWLAMELITGTTLLRWNTLQPRRWQEVLAVLVPAGRGLAAAHAAGLLHRDIKPENIMVREDGRVCVMDFGLARVRDGSSDDDLQAPAPQEDVDDVMRSNLTGAGSLLGTPAYMAPEQFSGGWPDVRTDQFSLCVTLWELLYRQLPFDGLSLAELAQAVTDGDLQAPPARSRVPSWLRRACERGLSPEPDDRWPSIEALLTALERGQARARRRLAMGAVALTLAGVAGVWGWQQAERTRGIAQCETEGTAIESSWNEQHRSGLHDAFVRARVVDADAIEARVVEGLDAHVAAWRQTRIEACLAAEVERSWPREDLERSLWCLDERQMKLDALIAELLRAESSAATRAVRAVTRLSPPAECTDPKTLERTVAPPPEQREASRRVLTTLARATALIATGHYAASVTEAELAVDRATELDAPELSATARVTLGRALQRAGRYPRAERTLEEAYFDAARIGAHTVAADAALSLTNLVGTRLTRHEEGIRWGQLAEVALVTLDDIDSTRMAAVHNGIGGIYASTDRYDLAKDRFENALSIQESILGPQHPDIALTLTNLALVLVWTETADAEPLMQRALTIQEHALGANHPAVAFALNNLASVARRKDQLERAESLYQRSLRIRRLTLGSEHVDVAQGLNNLANVLLDGEKWAQARPMLEESLKIFETVHGSDHVYASYPLHGLSRVARAQERWSDAVALAERTVLLRKDAKESFRIEAEIILLQCLWNEGRDRPRALAMAHDVLERARALKLTDQVADLEKWLAGRSASSDVPPGDPKEPSP